MAAESLAERIARDAVDAERHDARDAWREHGGSRRRPLKSFLTDAERAEMRAEHRRRLDYVREWISTPDGMREFLIARELNPEMSTLNQGLVGYQAPRAIVCTSAGWKRNACRVRKGSHASAYLTGPPSSGFWPMAAFTAAQTDAPPELVEPAFTIPDAGAVGELAETYRSAFRDVGAKPAIQGLMAEILERGQIPGETSTAHAPTPGASDEIPF